MMRGHWDGLALLARMVGSTPSGVLCALVEQAVADAAAAVGAVDEDQVVG
jgi:3,4-dihydroxy-2-butanone 4-phosphate synthase